MRLLNLNVAILCFVLGRCACAFGWRWGTRASLDGLLRDAPSRWTGACGSAGLADATSAPLSTRSSSICVRPALSSTRKEASTIAPIAFTVGCFFLSMPHNSRCDRLCNSHTCFRTLNSCTLYKMHIHDNTNTYVRIFFNGNSRLTV